jgi:hypothetical protein
VVWRVGDGSNINIWTDPWLNRDDARFPITPRGQCVLSKIEELINPVTGQWDEDLVRQTFMDMDVETILAIPIREDFEDFIAWQFDSKGCFSVKSAYKIYIGLRDGPQATTSNGTEGMLQWHKIWRMPCVPKVQQFIWRLAHNSLPVKRNIERRGIECDTLCVCCRRLDEDGAHLFLKCKQVKKIWCQIGLEDVRDHLCTLQTSEAMVQRIHEIDTDKQILLCCTLWRWWTCRNKLNAEGQNFSVDEVVRQGYFWAAECYQYVQTTSH